MSSVRNKRPRRGRGCGCRRCLDDVAPGGGRSPGRGTLSAAFDCRRATRGGASVSPVAVLVRLPRALLKPPVVSRFAAAARDRRGVAGLACARRVRGSEPERDPDRAGRLFTLGKRTLTLLGPARLAGRTHAWAQPGVMYSSPGGCHSPSFTLLSTRIGIHMPTKIVPHRGGTPLRRGAELRVFVRSGEEQAAHLLRHQVRHLRRQPDRCRRWRPAPRSL